MNSEGLYTKKNLFIINIFKVFGLIWRSSKYVTLVSIILNIINGSIVPVNALISKYFIDSVVFALQSNEKNRAFFEVIIWLSIQLALSILNQLIGRLSSYFYDCQTKLFKNYITELIIEKTNSLDISFFEDPRFYNDIDKTNGETASRCMNIISISANIIKSISILVGSIVIVINLSPIIVILSFVTAVPIFFVNYRLVKKKYSIITERLEEVRFVRYLQGMISNYNHVKEIILSGLRKYMKDNILAILKKQFTEDMNFEKKQIVSLSIIDIVNNLISYSFKAFAVYKTISNHLTIGSMTMFFTALGNVDGSIKNILDSMANLYGNNLYIDSLFTLLKLEPRIKNKTINFEMSKKICESIEFSNVSFKYPNTDKYILKNINLKIEANETCALVGINGCGKSTLVKLLTRLYDPTEGTIYIDGRDIREYSIESLHKSIGVVFQDFNHYPSSVKDNIGFGNIENINNMDMIESAAQKSGASEFIKKLPKNFGTMLEKFWTGGTELSTGQWQKLAIGRLFMNNGALLIFDEPTASLDAQAEYELFQNFKGLTKEKTCLLISHRFSSVKLADRIFVINDGIIVESGNHTSLINKNGLYAKFYKMQADTYIDSDSVDCIKTE